MTPRRHFQDWISAYFEYAKDDFCPDSFHFWTGMSVLSGALERKVALREGHIMHYPNTFIMLVANPGVGKSTAITRGTSLLEDMGKDFPPAAEFKIMSGQMTQAGLMEEMKVLRAIGTNGHRYLYSSGYYYAPEASNSGLQNLAGDFNATITELYDCADSMKKRLKTMEYKIPNPSLCVLAGSTFDFLKTLVNQNSVMGGLASRFIYVTVKERREVKSLWGIDNGMQRGDRNTMRMRLIEDLRVITQLQGEFKIEKRALERFHEWWHAYQADYLATESERMQSIMTRKPTTLKKILMLISVSERSDLGVTLEHMEKAIKMVDEVTKDNASIITSALIADKNQPASLNQMIMQAVKARGGVTTKAEIQKAYVTHGGDSTRFDPVFNFLVSAGILAIASKGNALEVELLVDPDKFV